MGIHDSLTLGKQLKISVSLIGHNREFSNAHTSGSKWYQCNSVWFIDAIGSFGGNGCTILFKLVDAELLDSVDTEIPSLALVYKSIIQPDANISIASPDLDLEAFVFTLFSKDADNIDPKTISQFKKHYSDSLILDFAVSWLGLVNTTLDSNTNDADSPINLKNSYYFFDELTSSSNTDSAKNLINLLACQLKLGNIPESIECIEKLDTLNVNPKWTYSLLINKIALNSLTSNSLERNRLIEELKNKFPNSPYVHDLNEKSELFDSIVESYN